MSYDVVRDLRQLADWAETVLLKIDKAGLPKPDRQNTVDAVAEFSWDAPDVVKYSTGFARFVVGIRMDSEVEWDHLVWKSGGSITYHRWGEFKASDALPEDFIKTLQDVVKPLKETK